MIYKMHLDLSISGLLFIDLCNRRLQRTAATSYVFPMGCYLKVIARRCVFRNKWQLGKRIAGSITAGELDSNKLHQECLPNHILSGWLASENSEKAGSLLTGRG